jgi:hypothetical protein
MPNQWQIPTDVEARLRRLFKACAYCRLRMRAHRSVIGVPGDKATIEHLNRLGPFLWSKGVAEKHVVIVCGRCNASRGRQRLIDWFTSTYCVSRGITAGTVASRVRQYLRAPAARR